MSTRIEAEVAVVGGGTAGAVVAARLAAAGRDVLVIEAGPDYGPVGAGGWPADLLDAITLPTSHDWGYRAQGAAASRCPRPGQGARRVLRAQRLHAELGLARRLRRVGAALAGLVGRRLEPAFARARAALRLRHYAARRSSRSRRRSSRRAPPPAIASRTTSTISTAAPAPAAPR